jgi:hypothetical protein
MKDMAAICNLYWEKNQIYIYKFGSKPKEKRPRQNEMIILKWILDKQSV